MFSLVRHASVYALLLGIAHSYAATLSTVNLDNGTFIGFTQNTTSAFLGIPYALPPVGDLRMRPPVANEPYTKVHNATVFGAPCILQNLSVSTAGLNPSAAVVLNEFLGSYSYARDSEDCLTANVWMPANATPDSKLPVLYFLYGSGFEAGESSPYDGAAIVERSLELGEPVVAVSINYRVSALGFPGGVEAREAGVGNLGLRDQREGMRWVQKYVSEFGGDPSKVTIWGGSAGAISVMMQMFTNGGDNENLFRGAFMSSGGPVSVGSVEDVQARWDFFTSRAGCGAFSGNASVFDCLRNVPLDNIRAAQDASSSVFGYGSIAVPWFPSADGDFLPAPPQQLLLNGSIADVPFITGDCDDEATLFSLASSNITTDEELKEYLSQTLFPKASKASIEKILSAYPADPAQGSPFDTGLSSSITPEYKRVAALIGDLAFQAPRRLLLCARSGQQPAYSYLYKRGKSTPLLGSYHTSDITSIYAGSELLDYLIYFAATLDPERGGSTHIEWPRYTRAAPRLMTFLDGATPLALTEDTYRAKAIGTIIAFNMENTL